MRSFLIFCALNIVVAGPVAAGQPDADNTEKNVRDRGGDTVTPMDQGSSPADREVTAAIRRAIVDDGSLSSNAHNVKIVTANGVVTLRGPVKSAAEKATIGAKAQKTKGVKRIENQLEVEAE
jgi:hyperosmotically inducible periplasmic protein